MRFKKIKVNDSDIAYQKIGDRRKKKLLLVHGMLTSSSYYSDTIEYLKDDFNILAVDMPGFGLSDRLKGKKHTVKNLAGSIKDLCRKLKFKGFCLVGASLGGMVSIKFTSMFPRYVNKLILQGTPWRKDSIGHPFVDYLYLYIVNHKKILKIFQKFQKNVTRENLHKVLKVLNKDYYKFDREDGEVYYFFKVMDIKLQRQVWESIKKLDLTEEVGSIGKETSVIIGDNDENITIEEAKKLADTLSKSKLEVVKNGSHCLFWDYPEKMADIIKNFYLS